MSRISSLSSNAMLRQYAQGSAQSRLSARADFLAPTVEVAAPVGKYKSYSATNRFHVPDTRRQIGGRAVEITYGAEDKTYNCEYHAVDVPMDKIEADSAEELIPFAQEAMDLAADVEALSHERTVVNKALAAVGAGTDSNFGSGSVDPVAVLDAKINAVMKATMGLGEVRIAWGPTAAERFKNNPLVRGRVTIGKGPQGVVNLGVQDYGSLLLGNPKCELFMMVEDTAAQGVAPSYSYLLDTAIIIFVARKNPTRYDPSFMKTFRKMGAWMRPRFYERDDGRVEVAGVDWSEEIQVTNSAAAERINATNA